MTTTKPTVHRLEVEGGTLAFEVAGAAHPVTADTPLVVLAHGMGDDRRAYRFVAPALAEAGFRVASVDLRGCGESSTGWASYTRTALAGDLVAVTEHLLSAESPDARAVLVGHSIAGGAATIAAATAPHLFVALVEVAPFTRKQSVTLRDLRDRRFRRGMRHLLAAAVLGSRAAWSRYLDLAYPVSSEGSAASGRPADHDARMEEIRRMLGEPGRMRALKRMGGSSPADAGEHLGRVPCPVLVVQGADDPDWTDPRAEGERILADLPAGPVRQASRLQVIEGSGHYPHVQHADRVVELVLDFVAASTGGARPGAQEG